MIKKEEAKKLVTIENKGSLPELGGISGPILNPCYIPVETLIRMINNRRRIYEVNPKDYSKRVLLTIKNVKTENFKPVTTPTTKTSTVSKKTEETVADTKVESKKEVKSDFTKK